MNRCLGVTESGRRCLQSTPTRFCKVHRYKKKKKKVLNDVC
jgi:hypothetical protein